MTLFDEHTLQSKCRAILGTDQLVRKHHVDTFLAYLRAIEGAPSVLALFDDDELRQPCERILCAARDEAHGGEAQDARGLPPHQNLAAIKAAAERVAKAVIAAISGDEDDISPPRAGVFSRKKEHLH